MAKRSINDSAWFDDSNSRSYACSKSVTWWQTAKGAWVREELIGDELVFSIGTERLAQVDIQADNPELAASVAWEKKNLADKFPQDEEV